MIEDQQLSRDSAPWRCLLGCAEFDMTAIDDINNDMNKFIFPQRSIMVGLTVSCVDGGGYVFD